MSDPVASSVEPRPFGARWNWRIVGMLAIFTVIIAASVIVADVFATRDRSPLLPTTTMSTPQ